MSREWKPGDVALVTLTKKASASIDGTRKHVAMRDRVDSWASGTTLNRLISDHEVKDVRPLVVIDPEDREAVERLRVDLINSGWIPDGDADALDDILRHFANPKPPRPDEPTGLGAVVEDEDGTKWLRHDSVAIHRRWLNTDDCETRYRAWDELTAARVLSPGVEVDL